MVFVHVNIWFQKSKLAPNINNGVIAKIVKKKFLDVKDPKIQIKKKRLEEKKKSVTVKDLLNELRHDLDVSIPPELADLNLTKAATGMFYYVFHVTAIFNSNLADDSDTDRKENKKPMSLDNVTDAIESVIKGCKVLSEKKVDDENGRETKTTETVNNSIKPGTNIF